MVANEISQDELMHHLTFPEFFDKEYKLIAQEMEFHHHGKLVRDVNCPSQIADRVIRFFLQREHSRITEFSLLRKIWNVFRSKS